VLNNKGKYFRTQMTGGKVKNKITRFQNALTKASTRNLQGEQAENSKENRD
jgi:hypothetical protein